MVRAGDEIRRPDGHRMRFLTTAADSGGALLAMEVTYEGVTRPPPVHLHPSQEETFEVHAGVLHTWIAGTERTYGPGATFTIAAGAPHTMHAAADGPTRFTWSVRPALRTEAMFEKIWRDAAAGRGDDLLTSAMLMHAYQAEFQLARPPRWLQAPAFAMLAAIGRLFGR